MEEPPTTVPMMICSLPVASLDVRVVVFRGVLLIILATPGFNVPKNELPLCQSYSLQWNVPVYFLFCE